MEGRESESWNKYLSKNVSGRRIIIEQFKDSIKKQKRQTITKHTWAFGVSRFSRVKKILLKKMFSPALRCFTRVDGQRKNKTG